MYVLEKLTKPLGRKISEIGSRDRRGTPFIRGIHFNLENGNVSINHPGYTSSIPKEALERSQAMWKGPIDARGISRIACQAIVNAQQDRRLRWVVVPPDCVLGNSVNFLELPEAVQDSRQKSMGLWSKV